MAFDLKSIASTQSARALSLTRLARAHRKQATKNETNWKGPQPSDFCLRIPALAAAETS